MITFIGPGWSLAGAGPGGPGGPGAPGGPAGPAPNSGDCVPDGSGFVVPNGPNGGIDPGKGPAPNSGDGIPDGSGF